MSIISYTYLCLLLKSNKYIWYQFHEVHAISLYFCWWHLTSVLSDQRTKIVSPEWPAGSRGLVITSHQGHHAEISWCISYRRSTSHDDVIKWKHFPRYWPFVRGIHRSPVNSTHKGQWRGALMFSLICAWINGWINTCEAGDLRRHRAH